MKEQTPVQPMVTPVAQMPATAQRPVVVLNQFGAAEPLPNIWAGPTPPALGGK